MSAFHRSDPLVIHAARDAARAVWLHVRREGLQRDTWGWSVLPDGAAALPAVDKLRDLTVTRHTRYRPSDAEPTQLLLRLPDEDTARARIQHEPHVDRTPDGERYSDVVGVTLTPAPQGTAIARGIRLGFHVGEVFGWTGDVEHHGVLNLTGAPRLTAYWRFR